MSANFMGMGQMGNLNDEELDLLKKYLPQLEQVMEIK